MTEPSGWALAWQVLYIGLLGLAVWCALALLIALGWHLLRATEAHLARRRRP